MNVSIIYKSLSYIKSNFRILCQARTDFYHELTKINYEDKKLLTSVEKNDSSIFDHLFELNKDIRILDLLFYKILKNKINVNDASFLSLIKKIYSSNRDSHILNYILETNKVLCFEYILRTQTHITQYNLKFENITTISKDIFTVYLNSKYASFDMEQSFMFKLCMVNRTDTLELFICKHKNNRCLLNLLLRHSSCKIYSNIKLLLDYGADPNQAKFSDLIDNDLATVKLFLDHGYKVGDKNKQLIKNKIQVYKLLSEN